jgi:hypothetical protein
VLPDKAVDQLIPGEVSRHVVVRIGDEVLIDLMQKACGIDYATAVKEVEYRTIDAVNQK